MVEFVVTGAQLSCSMGTSPGAFTGSCTAVKICKAAAGVVNDIAMSKNIAPFGMCQSLANPAVAAATAAAMGALTPQPCTPMVAGPWSPGATHVKLEKQAGLLKSDMATCAYAGTITVSDPGQTAVKGV